jgi:hypothetical protein
MFQNSATLIEIGPWKRKGCNREYPFSMFSCLGVALIVSSLFHCAILAKFTRSPHRSVVVVTFRLCGWQQLD